MWEYKVFRYLENILDEEKPKDVKWSKWIEKALNEVGSEGWELIGFDGAWIFKRKIVVNEYEF